MLHQRGVVPAITLCLAALAVVGHAKVSLPSVFGDNMILQSNSHYGARAFMYGDADVGEVVTVTVGRTTYTTTGGANGRWSVQLNPTASGHVVDSIVVKGSNSTDSITIKNAMYGDVYFCSGQSNMVFPLKLAFNASAEAASVSELPKLRTFSTALTAASSPAFTVDGSWTVPNATTILDFSAVCFMTVRDMARMLGNEKTPIGLIQSAWGGTRVEAWMSPDALGECKQYGPVPPSSNKQNNASALWNGMVNPFLGFTVRSALWYQGEANAAAQDTQDYYACMFSTMITSWRNAWGIGDFPFLFMQLPPSVLATAAPSNTGRPTIRAAQALAQPRHAGPVDTSGMAVTLDLGGVSAWGVDHPPNKNEMSRRLALAGLHTIYAYQAPFVNYTGPVFASAKAAGKTVTLTFNNTDGAVGEWMELHAVVNCSTCCTDDGSPFEVSNDKGSTWSRVPTSSVSFSGNTVQLAAGVDSVTSVRYAWTDFVQCVLRNSISTLVAAPFSASIAASVEPEGGSANAASGLPLAPPMGFNSWNAFHCNIDENTVIATGQLFIDKHLKDAGFEYVNIDDCWQALERQPDNVIRVDPVRFPSGFTWLSQQLHSMGLKFGIYTAAHEFTCQGRPGSYQHEEIDASTYCGFEIDYLKIDQCGGKRWPAANTSWVKFADGFKTCEQSTGRAIVESVESCGTLTGCGEWIADVANLWRVHGDIQATWASVMSVIETNNKLWSLAKPYHFNDPDMLQVGNVGLSQVEATSHFSLWCIMAAPLLIGTDLVTAEPWVFDVFTNTEIIAINQDPMVSQGRRMVSWAEVSGGDSTSKVSYNSTDDVPAGAREVWGKQMSDGTVAALALNCDDTSNATITVSFANLPGLGDSTTAHVRDVWAKKDLGAFAGSVSVTVVPHGQVTLRITPM